jgi:hypothetical protein
VRKYLADDYRRRLGKRAGNKRHIDILADPMKVSDQLNCPVTILPESQTRYWSRSASGEAEDSCVPISQSYRDVSLKY